jgi:hypothetical protein
VAWACILEVVEVVAVSSVEPACKRASLVVEDEELEAVVCTVASWEVGVVSVAGRG